MFFVSDVLCNDLKQENVSFSLFSRCNIYRELQLFNRRFVLNYSATSLREAYRASKRRNPSPSRICVNTCTIFESLLCFRNLRNPRSPRNPRNPENALMKQERHNTKASSSQLSGVIQAFASGMSLKKAAHIYSVPRSVLHRYCQKFASDSGKPTRRKVKSSERHEAIFQLRDSEED